MRLADLPAGTLLMGPGVATAVEAREVRESDVLEVGGTAVTVTGTEDHDLKGMTRIPVTWHPYEDETVRCERWTLPGATRLTPRRLLRAQRVECRLCGPGTGHDVLVDRVAEGWVDTWVCDAHLRLS
ncbi:hypothetical protein [Streptomyces qinglanensis]|uniref:hypothetical protein n=1 Tax=Streptomyces qinglanensis TaxID=943816 RepID=UPI003D75713E